MKNNHRIFTEQDFEIFKYFKKNGEEDTIQKYWVKDESSREEGTGENARMGAMELKIQEIQNNYEDKFKQLSAENTTLTKSLAMKNDQVSLIKQEKEGLKTENNALKEKHDKLLEKYYNRRTISYILFVILVFIIIICIIAIQLLRK